MITEARLNEIERHYATGVDADVIAELCAGIRAANAHSDWMEVRRADWERKANDLAQEILRLRERIAHLHDENRAITGAWTGPLESGQLREAIGRQAVEIDSLRERSKVYEDVNSQLRAENQILRAKLETARKALVFALEHGRTLKNHKEFGNYFAEVMEDGDRWLIEPLP